MSGRCNGNCGCGSGCQCGNGCNRNTNYAGDMKNLLASILSAIEKNTALHEKNTALLDSILGEMKQSNHNKQDENRPLGNGEEHINVSYGGQSLHQSVRPLPSVPINTKQQEVKSQADSLGDGSSSSSSSSNNTKSFVVVDLRATCWNTEENKDGRLMREIVEFSSVLVDAATGHTKSTFHEYVIPTENHLLSEYCKKSNGIKQEDVDSNYAMSLDKALEKHQAWIRRLTNGNSAAAVVVTWSNWVCRTMLKQECSRKKLDIPDYFHRWIHLKTPFAEKYGDGYWKKSVKEALEATELKWEGAIKGGESHAHNKARLLSLLIHQGANLAITSWLDPAAAAPNN